MVGPRVPRRRLRYTAPRHGAHSSSGLGHRPLTAAARVRIPYGPFLTAWLRAFGLDARVRRAVNVAFAHAVHTPVVPRGRRGSRAGWTRLLAALLTQPAARVGKGGDDAAGAELRDDDELLVPFDHALDLRHDVPRLDDEVCRHLADALVFVERQLDALVACEVGALADELAG